MREYRFLSTWCVDAPIDPVFAAIDDCGRWPDWWQGMRRAEVLEAAEQGGGELRSCTNGTCVRQRRG